MLLTPAQIKPQSFKSRRNSFSFFTRGGCASCLRACLGARLLPQSYQYPKLSEGADGFGGQLRGDKECPFSGVTKSGRVWRKVPESGARSVLRSLCGRSADGRPAALSGSRCSNREVRVREERTAIISHTLPPPRWLHRHGGRGEIMQRK